MALIDFKRIKRVLATDKTVFKEIAEDRNALTEALIVVVLSIFIGSIWDVLISGYILSTLMFMLVGIPIGWVISGGILHILAKILGGKASYANYLKVVGYSTAPEFLGIIPIVGSVIGALWSIKCLWYATKEVHELSWMKAAIVVGLPMLIYAAIILYVVMTSSQNTLWSSM